MKRRRRELREDLYEFLWRYRFAGGVNTKEAADAIADYIEARYEPKKKRKIDPARGETVEEDPRPPA
jgi:hypothetical protein